MTTTTEKQELPDIKDGSLYFPPYAKSLKDQAIGQLRVGLQGLQGIGKTWAALTFPNPVVINFDRGLAAHLGKTNVTEIPFYDDKFINETLNVKNNFIKNIIDKDRRPNRKDALTKFLHEEGHKFKQGQTLILDSWTTIHNAFDIQTNYDPPISKRTGEVDTFAFWAEKISYSTEIVELIKTFECDVVITFHETFDRDKDDRIIGVGPLMQGKFKDQLSAHMTDWFRIKFLKITDEKQLNPAERELIKEFSKEVVKGDSAFVFQVNKDDIALSCKTSRTKIPADVRYIPACYNAFMKYA